MVLSVSLPCMLIPLLSSSYFLTLAAFCSFEAMLGIYWPTMSVLRAQYVPEVLTKPFPEFLSISSYFNSLMKWKHLTSSIPLRRIYWCRYSKEDVWVSCNSYIQVFFFPSFSSWNQSIRSSIMALFRIPLNLLVIIVLVCIGFSPIKPTSHSPFAFCTLSLACGLCFCRQLQRRDQK